VQPLSLCEPFHKLLGVQHSDKVVMELELLARALYPYEAGAVVCPDGVIHVLDNIADDPLSDFRMPPQEHRLLKPGCILWHSHPAGPNYPSYDDQKSQLHGANGWAISSRDPETDLWEFFCWGDQLKPLPLVGRNFKHFIADCYSVVRDEFKTRDILLPECPRPFRWWKELGGSHIIMDHLARIGCDIEYSSSFRPQPGDVAVMQVRSRVINHLAVLTEGFKFLHHLDERLSAHEQAEDYMAYVRGWIRYAGP
jgi:proteasome lid subunit RPN8/RPN11